MWLGRYCATSASQHIRRQPAEASPWLADTAFFRRLCRMFLIPESCLSLLACPLLMASVIRSIFCGALALPGPSVPYPAATCLRVLGLFFVVVGYPSFVYPVPFNAQRPLRSGCPRIVGGAGGRRSKPTCSLYAHSGTPESGLPRCPWQSFACIFLSFLYWSPDVTSNDACGLRCWKHVLLGLIARALFVSVKLGPCVLPVGLHACWFLVIASVQSHHSMLLGFSLAIRMPSRNTA